MENCFVTKLKASADNPDLPILETMQQFTLNAIAKSGNVSMTDEQKWALNHFFYQVGAVGNTGIWNKIRTIFIPIIGATKNNIVLDYKNDGVSMNSSSKSMVNQGGALEAVSGLAIFSTNYPNLTATLKGSAFCAVAAVGSSMDSNTYVGIKTGEISRISGIAGSPYVNSCLYDDGTTTVTKRFSESSVTAILGNFGSDAIKGYAVKDGNIIETTTTAYGDYDSAVSSVTNEVYAILCKAGVKYGLLAEFSFELTDDEAKTFLSASVELRNAFVE